MFSEDLSDLSYLQNCLASFGCMKLIRGRLHKTASYFLALPVLHQRSATTKFSFLFLNETIDMPLGGGAAVIYLFFRPLEFHLDENTKSIVVGVFSYLPHCCEVKTRAMFFFF